MTGRPRREDAERLLAERLAGMRRALATAEPDEDALTETQILGITRRQVWDIQLSWGGPADWLRVWLDEAGHVHAVEYHYADWFYHHAPALTEPERAILTEWVERFVALEA